MVGFYLTKILLEKDQRWTLVKWRHSGILIVNFEQISLIVQVFPLLILNKVNASWDCWLLALVFTFF